MVKPPLVSIMMIADTTFPGLDIKRWIKWCLRVLCLVFVQKMAESDTTAVSFPAGCGSYGSVSLTFFFSPIESCGIITAQCRYYMIQVVFLAACAATEKHDKLYHSRVASMV